MKDANPQNQPGRTATWNAGPRCRLLGECIAALSSPSCSEATLGAMLGALEAIFDLPDPLGPQVLAPHLRALLEGLQAIVVAGGLEFGY